MCLTIVIENQTRPDSEHISSSGGEISNRSRLGVQKSAPAKREREKRGDSRGERKQGQRERRGGGGRSR